MGNTCKDEVVDFCEQVLFKNGPVEDIEAQWATGTWLGKRWRSGEHWIHSEGGINKCYGIQRVPLEDREIKEDIAQIFATLWRHNPSPQYRADDARVLVPLPEDGRSADQPRPREPEIREPQRPRIAKFDLSRCGYTDGCYRCRQMTSGRAEDGTK